MPRPPGNADKLMLAAGKRLVQRSGFANLRVREIVDTAGVNLGMFHYHFKTRDRFNQALFEEIYGELMTELGHLKTESSDPTTQLRSMLLAFGRFLRENHKIVLSLFRDMLVGEPTIFKLARKQIPPHATMIRSLIRKGQKQGVFFRAPFTHFAPLIFGAVAQPLIFYQVAAHKKMKRDFSDLQTTMSDEALRWRIDAVLKGVRVK